MLKGSHENSLSQLRVSKEKRYRKIFSPTRVTVFSSSKFLVKLTGLGTTLNSKRLVRWKFRAEEVLLWEQEPFIRTICKDNRLNYIVIMCVCVCVWA